MQIELLEQALRELNADPNLMTLALETSIDDEKNWGASMGLTIPTAWRYGSAAAMPIAAVSAFTYSFDTLPIGAALDQEHASKRIQGALIN